MRKYILSYDLNSKSNTFRTKEKLREALIELLLAEKYVLSSNEETTIILCCDKTFDAVRRALNRYADDMFYTLTQVAKVELVEKFHVLPNHPHAVLFDAEVEKIKKKMQAPQ